MPDLDEAYLTLQPLLSHAAATVFGLSLVVAGLSSTVVGTLAGQVVMQIGSSLPYPAVGASYSHHVAVIYCHSDGIDPTRILVMSQVLLSFGIALALVPLLISPVTAS
ncbi:divalent metal cation transporter [Escherichia coli]